jgi:hypothetical protein
MMLNLSCQEMLFSLTLISLGYTEVRVIMVKKSLKESVNNGSTLETSSKPGCRPAAAVPGQSISVAGKKSTLRPNA